MASKTDTKNSGVRFNIFDVIIIFLVLACIAAIVIRAYFTANIKEDFTSATVEFSVIGVSENTAASFHPARKIYLASGDDEIGSIDDVTYGPSAIYAVDSSGKPVSAFHPDKKDVHGTATLYGLWTDDGFMINGTVLALAGKTVSVYTQDVECILTIVSITRTES